MRKGRDEFPRLLSGTQGHGLARLDRESLHGRGNFTDDNNDPGGIGIPREAQKGALARPFGCDLSRPVEVWEEHGPA